MGLRKYFKIRAVGAGLTAALLLGSCAFAGDVSGGWVFDKSPEFPGFTRIIIQHQGDLWSGTVTSYWYGDLRLKNVQMKDGVLHFHIFNGNTAVPMKDITLRVHGDSVMMTGSVWFSKFNIPAHKARAGELKSYDFPTDPLPVRKELAQQNLAPTPPMGWSSWNKFATEIDDKTIRQIADAMVKSGLRDAGYRYINIDDGWQGKRDVNGVLQPNKKFPDMKALADYVHARGLKLGIYTTPGPKSCAGYEGSYGHIQQDADTYARWGIDYLKYDLCSGEAFYYTADSVYRVYQKMGAALQATRRDIVYSLCEYGRFDVGSWGRNVGGHLWRTTGDISDDYKTMAHIGFDLNGVPKHSGPNGWNDPDMLEIGNGGMTAEEYRTHLSLWSMLAAPLILGNDVRHMSADTVRMLTNHEVLAIDQDAKGAQGLPIKKADGLEIWQKPLADGSVAVAFFNRNPAEKSVNGSWVDLKLTGYSKSRDLWRHKTRLQKDSYAFRIPAHGVVMLRLTK